MKKYLWAVSVMSCFVAPLVSADVTDQQEKSRLDIDASVMVDYSHFDSVFNKGESGDELLFRRVRLGASYDISDSFEAEFDIGYDQNNDKVETKDVNLTYSGWDIANLRIGKFKQPFGLEYLTSSKNLATMERSMATSAFSLGRDYGVGIFSNNKSSTWSVGLFDGGDGEDTFTTYAVTGRVTRVISRTDDSMLHVGVSASWREGTEERYQINETAEIYAAKSIIESAKYSADTISQFAVDAIFTYDSLALQGEFFSQSVTVKPNLGESDAQFSGYYFQARYLFNGERHRYKNGRFVKVKPSSMRGAWELVGRVSSIDAEDQERGHTGDTVLVGLNYYVNKNIRLMGNYTYGDLEGFNVTDPSTGSAYLFRAQYVY